MVVHLIIMELTIIGLVILAGRGFTSIANFSEGIVEVMAVIANPILVSIIACGFGRVLHDRKRSQYYLILYPLILFYSAITKNE